MFVGDWFLYFLVDGICKLISLRFFYKFEIDICYVFLFIKDLLLWFCFLQKGDVFKYDFYDFFVVFQFFFCQGDFDVEQVWRFGVNVIWFGVQIVGLFFGFDIGYNVVRVFMVDEMVNVFIRLCFVKIFLFYEGEVQSNFFSIYYRFGEDLDF